MNNFFKVDTENVVLVMHKNPDADAVASLIIINKIIKKLNPYVNTYFVCDEAFKVPFPMSLKVEIDKVRNNNLPEDLTAYIIDHSEEGYSLLENGKNENIKDLRVIDHHYGYSKDYDYAIKLIDNEACATCEILFDYLKNYKSIEITKEVAIHLYLGMFADTLYLSIPLKERQVLKLAELIQQYGAEADKHQLYNRGKYFQFKKLMSGVFFLCASKEKDTRCIRIKLPLIRYQKLKDNYIHIVHILKEALTTREVNHVILLVETTFEKWNVYFSTNHFGLIKQGADKPQKANLAGLYSLTYEEAINKSRVIKRRLGRGERRQEPIESGEVLIADD